MSTAFKFKKNIYITDIPEPAMSVAAHLAAKLELFCTDERTLTDELCDMLCIWLASPLTRTSTAGPKVGRPFQLELAKQTTGEEIKNGADLEFIVRSPLGAKRCLIQAKVLDPNTGKLRCASKEGWRKLRTQLVKSRKEAGDLAFLLVYVPGGKLNGKFYGFPTYEQGHLLGLKSSPLESFWGATLIPVDNLLGPRGRWLSQKYKVPEKYPGHFKNGIPLWVFLMELLLCKRGKWSTLDKSRQSEGDSPFITLTMTAGETNPDAWRDLQASVPDIGIFSHLADDNAL